MHLEMGSRFEWTVLTSYAVITRYPDEFYMPTEKEAEFGLNPAVEVRNFVHDKLTLPLSNPSTGAGVYTV